MIVPKRSHLFSTLPTADPNYKTKVGKQSRGHLMMDQKRDEIHYCFPLVFSPNSFHNTLHKSITKSFQVFTLIPTFFLQLYTLVIR